MRSRLSEPMDGTHPLAGVAARTYRRACSWCPVWSTNTTNIIEHPELDAERLVRYAGVVGKEH